MQEEPEEMEGFTFLNVNTKYEYDSSLFLDVGKI